MKFDNQIYEKLIELVRNRPPIYNCRLAEHKDVQLQKNLWKAIADQMKVEGMTGEDWKKLWKQKRDCYMIKRKELMSAKSGAAAKVINKGPLHDQMLFLNDFIAATSTVSNLEDSMQASQDLFVETQLEPIGVETQMTQPSPSPPSRSLTPSTIDSAIPPTPEYGSGKTTQRAIKRKSEVSSSASNVAQAIEQASARSASNFATLREMFQSVDQDVDFYMYLSKKTKSFSSETQEWMEDEVMKVYMEAKRRDREMAQHLNGPNYRSYDNVMYYTGISDEQMRMPSASTYNQV